MIRDKFITFFLFLIITRQNYPTLLAKYNQTLSPAKNPHHQIYNVLYCDSKNNRTRRNKTKPQLYNKHIFHFPLVFPVAIFHPNAFTVTPKSWKNATPVRAWNRPALFFHILVNTVRTSQSIVDVARIHYRYRGRGGRTNFSPFSTPYKNIFLQDVGAVGKRRTKANQLT